MSTPKLITVIFLTAGVLALVETVLSYHERVTKMRWCAEVGGYLDSNGACIPASAVVVEVPITPHKESTR